MQDMRIGEDFAKSGEQERSRSLRWLKVIFQGTLLLLFFELGLGWAAGSITLLADAAHTGSDVVAYGLNWCVEWCKPSLARGTREETVRSQRVAQTISIIDTAGCVASLMALLSTTAWAASEAWYRLQLPTASGSRHVGSALLAFAAVSAAVNISMLRMYQWSRASPKENHSDISLRSDSGSSSPHDVLDTSTPLICQPCTPANQKPTFLDPAVQQITFPVEAQGPVGTEDADNGILAKMHVVIHPGCRCAQAPSAQAPTNDSSWQDESALSPEVQTETAQDRKLRNLNLAAAQIHLITDVLRCVLILVVALLIQVGVVQDAQHADALCGLVVSALVCMGSTMLLLRMAGQCNRFCGRLKLGSQGQEAPVSELLSSSV